MMLERDIPVDYSTINRCVIYYAPLLENEFSRKYKPKVGTSWRIDETLFKKGATPENVMSPAVTKIAVGKANFLLSNIEG